MDEQVEVLTPAKSCPLLALPTELLLKIVRMSRDQDQAFKERMVVSCKRVTDATHNILTAYKWYGRSLRALYATSKQLNSLCAPYVWETVKLSRTVDFYFSSSILPRYGTLVRHLDFDKYPHPSAFQGLLISTLSMPNLVSLAFTAAVGLDDSYLRRLVQGQDQANAAEPDRLNYCLRPALATLRSRIKTLFCDVGVPSDDFVAALSLWPGVTSLSRCLLYSEDEEAESAAVAKLASLQHLELGKEWSFGRLNLEEVHLNIETFHWTPLWSARDWGTVPLRTLCFAAQTLSEHEWTFITSFRNTLQELRLELIWSAIDPADASDPYPAETLPHFPHLQILSITGSLAAAQTVLRLLQRSPLRTVSFELFNINSKFAAGLLQDGIGSITSYSATLESVAIHRYGDRADKFIINVSRAIQSLGVRILHIPAKVITLPTFNSIGEDITNSELVRARAASIYIPLTPDGAMASARRLLELAQAELDKSDCEADSSRLDIVNLALRPLAALSLLDHD